MREMPVTDPASFREFAHSRRRHCGTFRCGEGWLPWEESEITLGCGGPASSQASEMDEVEILSRSKVSNNSSLQRSGGRDATPGKTPTKDRIAEIRWGVGQQIRAAGNELIDRILDQFAGVTEQIRRQPRDPQVFPRVLKLTLHQPCTSRVKNLSDDAAQVPDWASSKPEESESWPTSCSTERRRRPWRVFPVDELTACAVKEISHSRAKWRN